MEERSKTVQYLIAFSVSLVCVSVGCFTSWPAPMLTKFHDNTTGIDITDSEISWMVSISSPGFMVGSLATRFVSDSLGRRTSILGSALPAAVGTVIVATATKAWLLYVTRFLWGISTGMALTVIMMYIAEIAYKEIRGSLSMIGRFMFNFGNLLTMCIGPFVAYKTFNYMLLALPVLYLAVCWWIPESPYFLLKEGKVEQAKRALMTIRAYDDEKLVEDELLQLRADVRKDMRDSSTVKELFTGKKYRKAVIIAAGLKFTQILSGQLVVQEYLGLIMRESGTTMDIWLIFIIFGVVRFVISVISSFLADKVGRRPLLIHSFFGAGLALVVVGIYFSMLDILQLDHSVMKPYSIIPFAAIMASTVISSLGYYSVIALVPAEIFPLNVKAIAMTCLSIFGGFFNFFVAKGYQVIKDWTGLCGVFWFFGLAALLGGVFSYFYVPETRGKSLKDIQILLQGDLYETEEVLTKINETNCDIVLNKNQALSEEKEVLDRKDCV